MQSGSRIYALDISRFHLRDVAVRVDEMPSGTQEDHESVTPHCDTVPATARAREDQMLPVLRPQDAYGLWHELMPSLPSAKPS